MIGIYIVDGILLLGLGYLCCSPFKRTNFEENEIKNFSKNFNLEEKCSNYLSFEDENIV